MSDEKDLTPSAGSGEKKGDYRAENIQILEGLEGVRKNPGMYIGGSGPEGFHHMVYEVVDNSIDEAMGGYCDQIKVTILPDGSISVEDNGRGIPVDIHSKRGVPAAEVVLTVLHAGGKFDKKTYQVSGGLHGVGISVVNALSETLEVEICRDGNIHHQNYYRGLKQKELEVTGKTDRSGTKISFRPDRSIFGDQEFSTITLARRLRELAFLNRLITIEFEDQREGKRLQETYHYEGGIASYVSELNSKYSKKNQNDDVQVVPTEPIFFERQVGAVSVEVALQYCPAEGESLLSYANNIFTRDGGTHLQGLRSAVTRAVKNYAQQEQLLKDLKGELTGDDTRDGLVAILSIRLPHPQFHGQTKTKLINSDIRGIVESTVSDVLMDYFDQHPAEARIIVDKAKIAARGRMAARKAKEIERSTPLGGRSVLPGKLADCSEKDPSKCELYIVEGISAGGSAKGGRDRKTQAILPIRGKLLNVEKARVEKMLESNEIKALISAIGMGVGNVKDIEKLRYHRIIIMSDADVDGAHIRTLLLTFFYRQLPELIENGHLYIAQPPLYRVAKGKSEQYLKNETVFQEMMLQLGSDKVQLELKGDLVSGHEMVRRLRALAKFEGSLDYLNRRGYYGNVLRLFLLSHSDDEAFDDPDRLRALAEELKESYRKSYPEQRELIVDIEEIEEEEDEDSLEIVEDTGPKYALRVKADVDGNRHEFVLDKETLTSPLFFGVKSELGKVQEVGLPPYTLLKGEKQIIARNLRELVDAVMEEGRKGYHIQRYKGLGEMNDDQLWDTTMNPEKRTLLKVIDEDIEESEDTFQILMGDRVDPRREFIESNALDVKNLDT